MPKHIPAAGEAMPTIDRRTLLQGLVATAVAPAAASAMTYDPLLSTIRDYRAGCAAYRDDLTESDFDNDDDLFERTYAPPMRILTAWRDPAATPEGAIEALRLLKDERLVTEDIGFAMIDAVIGYLQGKAAQL